MNRRAFLLAVPFVPKAVRAILEAPPRAEGPEYRWQVNSGIYGMLKKCGDVVDPAEPDIDAIFDRLYAIKSRRPENTDAWVRLQ